MKSWKMALLVIVLVALISSILGALAAIAYLTPNEVEFKRIDAREPPVKTVLASTLPIPPQTRRPSPPPRYPTAPSVVSSFVKLVPGETDKSTYRMSGQQDWKIAIDSSEFIRVKIIGVTGELFVIPDATSFRLTFKTDKEVMFSMPPTIRLEVTNQSGAVAKVYVELTRLPR